ncbi:hypothetical protein MHU86_6817 [Fragilaria crotonensis]|nr:hypothetical protein MHU86_6817 [Fragilaria crotonensis]
MMRKTAEEFGIGPERWSSSLLYREWRKAQDDISSTAEDRAFQQSNGDVSIYLSPESDCAASNHSQSLKWTPWLTTCIRAFYNTGTVRFPNDCVGSDVLLALEYFGIVYTPDQLVFDSFGAYLRVKLWSEYFTHRSGLAQWVVETLMQTNSKHSHIFVTSPSLQEGDLLVGSKRADVLDGHLQLDPTKYAGTPSNAVVHDFFHDEDRPEDVQYPLDALMREDFAHYVENSLPGTRVTFTLKDVQVVRTGKTVKRATLHIAFVEPPLKNTLPPKQVRRVAKDSPGRKGSSVGSVASTNLALSTVTPPLPRVKKSPPAAPQVPRNARARSPSPVAMLRRVGSAIRSSTSSVESSVKISNSKSSVSEEENAAIREKSRQALSPDGVVGGKRQTPTDSAFQSNATEAALAPCPPSPAPFDEKDIVKLLTPAPSDEQKLEPPDPRAPVNAIWDGDMSTVISALTSPFREDESIKQSKSMALTEAQAPSTANKSTPSVSNAVPAATNKPPDSPRRESVEVALASRRVHRLLEEETTIDTATDFMSSLATDRSTMVDPFRDVRTGVRECGSSDILSSTFHYFFGNSKPEVKTRNRPNQCPITIGHDLDMDSLAGNGKGAMSTIEDFLPDVDLQTLADDPGHEKKASIGDESSETIESSAAAWLRRAINVNQMIFDDPVPASDDDEYLRLVRQAEAVKCKGCVPHDEFLHVVRKAEVGSTDYKRYASHDMYPHRSRKGEGAAEHNGSCMPKDTTSAGTLVKDILESLMNDNNSFLGGSVASTDASTTYSTAGSVSTPSTKLTKAGPFIPFDCDSSLESGDQQPVDTTKSRTSATQSSTPTSGGVAILSRFPSRERRRLPTPQRNTNRIPSESLGKSGLTQGEAPSSSRNGEMMQTTRHASPLSRIPALISGRKRGKNRGDETTETATTAKVHNGLKTGVPIDGAEGDTSAAAGTSRDAKTPPSRLAGLFRSKGLVRRRSLGEGGKELDQQVTAEA